MRYVTLVAIMLFAIVGCPAPTPTTSIVPNVVGLAAAEANAALLDRSLATGNLTEAYSATVPAGQVIAQNPGAGVSVALGTAVALTVSLGPEPVAVPNVVGMTEASAEAALVGAGLAKGTISQAFSDSVPEGSVISQEPQAGTEVLPGTAIALVISRGRNTVSVPDVYGISLAVATETLLEAGLLLGDVSEDYSESVIEGAVISQTPGAGWVVEPGTSVSLVISKGPILPPTAAFLATPRVGPTPLGVTFQDMSDPGTGTISSWAWQSGGTTSSQQNFSHAYLVPGSYEVSLTVESEYGADTATQTIEALATGMIFVDTSSFLMGDPWGEGKLDERPVHTVWQSRYNIGVHEVTNRAYMEALNWNGGLVEISSESVEAYGVKLLDIDAPGCQIGYDGEAFFVESRDGFSMAYHPVVCVTWYGAAAYCNWLSEKDGLRPCYDTATWACDFRAVGSYHLPTEAQWERAAAWDLEEERHWRYGNGKDGLEHLFANYDNENPLGFSQPPYTTPAGHYGAKSPSGCYDMAGNVWEWCNDWHARAYTNETAYDPEGPETGTERMVRGGSWGNSAFPARSSNRLGFTPETALDSVGFRVAR